MEEVKRRPITRNRELLACTECRRRKLKCDRNVPCSSCVKRNDDGSCSYQRFARRERHRENKLEAESRLEHLEGLVQQLAASQSTTSHPSSLGSSNQQSDEISDARTNGASTDLPYSGSTHWSAMLEDIEELRFSMAYDDNDLEDVSPEVTTDDGGTSYIFGAAPALPFSQILALYLPSRQEADRLTSAYFRSNSVVAPFIHTRYFRRKYHQFWLNPSGAPPLWTSMLFSVLHIASTTITAGKFHNEADGNYLLASAQCLAVGKYYEAKQFAVESLLLFVQSKCFRSYDITPELGFMMASVIRLAIISGYHRDPETFSLSPFQKEMRRRSWSLCLQLDLLLSFALGLPSNVPFSTHDTQPPRNLQDSDFDEQTIELPPARPDSEPTSILFYIAKHKLMSVFEKILRHALSTEKSSNTDLRFLEQELDQTYAALPEILKPRPIAESIVDPSTLVVTRLCVLFLYEKCRCVLHRKYATVGRVPSVQTCHEASSKIVGYVVDIFPDLQPGGQFEHERWFNSTLTWHDFLLGVMVLCLVLCVSDQGQNEPIIDYLSSMSLLRKAQDVCAQVSYKSKYTMRVQRLVEATVLRFPNLRDGLGAIAEINGDYSSTPWKLPLSGNGQLTAIERAVGGVTNDQLSNLASHDDPWNPLRDDQTSGPIDDISWTYLDQLLNLPSDEFAMST